MKQGETKMAFDLESLGFTKAELQERVIDRLVGQLMSGAFVDSEGEEYADETEFIKKLNKRIQEKIDASISALAEKHVLPNVVSYIENLCLQETNKWGEAKGTKLTFVEYLVKKAEEYMTEKVSYNGKTQAEDSYNWRGTQTRIAHLLHEHLHYSIERAMKEALQVANNSITKGLETAVKIKLDEIVQNMKVAVELKD